MQTALSETPRSAGATSDMLYLAYSLTHTSADQTKHNTELHHTIIIIIIITYPVKTTYMDGSISLLPVVRIYGCCCCWCTFRWRRKMMEKRPLFASACSCCALRLALGRMFSGRSSAQNLDSAVLPDGARHGRAQGWYTGISKNHLRKTRFEKNRVENDDDDETRPRATRNETN